jgi:hypothetical protein
MTAFHLEEPREVILGAVPVDNGFINATSEFRSERLCLAYGSPYSSVLMKRVSSCFPLSLPLLLAAALGTTACVDPAARFDEYSASVPRTSPQGAYFSTLADIGGQFYMLISLELFGHAPESWIHAVADVEYEDAGSSAVMNVSARGLRQDPPHELIGDAALTASNVVVESNGQFVMTVNGMLEGESTTTGQPATIDAVFKGYIQGSDFFCGTVTGRALSGSTPIDLQGSTFGAVRIEPGTTGAALPPAEKAACPREAQVTTPS